MLASILTESGEKTGLFTSPHISDFRERIRVNGAMISEERVLEFCKLIQHLHNAITPSFFEISFAMALTHFLHEQCTICVIETGLGGRLDATNIIQPLVSVITNISLEHTQFLGDTLDSIAFEKAGIIKQDTPVVIGESTPETKLVFTKFAQASNAPITWCEQIEQKHSFSPPLLGDYQEANLKTVLCTIDLLRQYGFVIPSSEIEQGLKNLHKNSGIFGRMHSINEKPLTILDVSHNYDGIEQTLKTIQRISKGRLHIIYGTSSDKDYEKIIELFPQDAALHFCLFQSARCLSKVKWEEYISHKGMAVPIFNSVTEAIQSLQSIANEHDTILVFGSFFLISDFF